MSAKKRKSSKSSKSKTIRYVVIAVVVIVIIILLLLKCSPAPAGDDWAAARITDEGTVVSNDPTATPTTVVSEAPKEQSQASATPELAPTKDDPFPEDPNDQIDWAIRNDLPSMVFFHSTTCVPCKNMIKVLEVVQPDYEGKIVFIDILTDDKDNADLVREASIRAVPTTFFLSGEGKGNRVVGGLDETTLREALDNLLAGGIQ